MNWLSSQNPDYKPRKKYQNQDSGKQMLTAILILIPLPTAIELKYVFILSGLILQQF